jgi:hypothetical protein
MPETAAIRRQAGYRNALARAYERLDRRDPRELVVRGKGSSPRKPLAAVPLAAVGDDALIIADELELPIEPDLVSSFAGARLEIPAGLIQQLIELPHRVRIVRAVVSMETGSKTVKFQNDVYVCGRLQYTATTTGDATDAAHEIQSAIDGKAAPLIGASSKRTRQPNSDTEERDTQE